MESINIINSSLPSDHKSLKPINVENYKIHKIYVPAIINEGNDDVIVLRDSDYIINEKNVQAKFYSIDGYTPSSIDIDIFVNIAKINHEQTYYNKKSIETRYAFLGKDSTIENIFIDADTIVTDKKGSLNNVICKNLYIVETEDFNNYIIKIKENAINYSDEVAQNICESLDEQISNLSKLSVNIFA